MKSDEPSDFRYFFDGKNGVISNELNTGNNVLIITFADAATGLALLENLHQKRLIKTLKYRFIKRMINREASLTDVSVPGRFEIRLDGKVLAWSGGK